MLASTEARWVCKGCRQQLLRPSCLSRKTATKRSLSTVPTIPSKNPDTKHLESRQLDIRLRPSEYQKLPSTPARTRFAPSPTGFLHLGSLRTALFNYLLARATKGQFLLRIEDTDVKRTVKGAAKRIREDLEWAGLQWDEGPVVGGPYGPYRQYERTLLYREHASKLLESGHAYRCFCTAERLHELAKERVRIGLNPEYDRTCMGISKDESDERAHKGEPHVVRFKSSSSYPKYLDLVYGPVGKGNRGPAQRSDQSGFEDPILLKSDGHATYHLANVVDDHLMKITHVVRAAEWMPSTPKHIAMYEAFGWQPPAFAHVGLLQDERGDKLSKRKADIDISYYRDQGYLPESVINFCALLGWSHQRKSDVFTMTELIDNFDLKFTKGNTKVMFPKLGYLQKHHIRRIIKERPEELEKLVDDNLAELRRLQQEESGWGVPDGRDERAYIKAVLNLRLKSGLGPYTTPARFLSEHKTLFSLSFVRADNVHQLDSAVLQHLYQGLADISSEEWEPGALRRAKTQTSAFLAEQDRTLVGEGTGGDNSPNQHKAEMALINKYLRWALLSADGPDTNSLMELLGKDLVLARLKDAEASGTKSTQT